MSSAKKIWLTRPQGDSEALAAQLGAMGIESIIAPVMDITPCTPAPFTGDAPSAILLTSRHAAHALTRMPSAWRAVPMYCVGTATAEAARAHGETIITGDGDMAALMPLLEQLPAHTHLLYLRGEEVKTDVAAALAPLGIRVSQPICYRAAECPMPETLRDALQARAIAAAVGYSAHSAGRMVAWLKDAGLEDAARTMPFFALSPAVAEAAKALPWHTIHVASAPNAEAMLAMIQKNFTPA